jgi:hypothetical protein
MEKSLVVTKTLVGKADEIAAAHEHFTTHYVVGGRMALYGLLGQMLALINEFESAIDREDLLAKIKYRLYSEFGIKTQKNSSDISVLIRYMTRADRKTAHVYTRTIEAAKANGVTPEALPAFIEGAGGVERIRALGANADISTDGEDDLKERIALTKEYLSSRGDLPLADFEATEFFDQATSGEAQNAYFVCIRKADGKFYVLSPLPATAELERLAMKNLSEVVCKDHFVAREGIARLGRYTNCSTKSDCAGIAIDTECVLTI